MGKKSRKPGKVKSATTTPVATTPASQQPANAVGYPSDGPSQEELMSLQTTSPSLQAKLDQLVDFIIADDRASFVRNFVPLDLSTEDTEAYLQDLTVAPEAAGQWGNLAAEMMALQSGRGVRKIEGDQISRAIFFFEHPLLPGCDREVCFVNVHGNEWRAEG